MRLTIEEIDEIWQSLSIGEEEIDMHEYAEAIEAAVLAKLASGQEPVAWQTFDGEGGYEFRQFAENETYYDDYIKRNGEKYSTWVVPLYTHPAPTGISQADCLWARNGNTPCTSSPAQQPLSDEWIAAFAKRGNDLNTHGWADNDMAAWVTRQVEYAHGIKEKP